MKRRFLLTIMLALSLSTLSLAQAPAGKKPAAPPPDDDVVVRINTDLIQFDVVVLDKKGNPVTDLTPDDFEVFEDKRKQKITNFSYVDLLAPIGTTSSPATKAAAANSAGKSPATAAQPAAEPVRDRANYEPARIERGQVGRTIALVFDDLNLSFESSVRAKDLLKKYVREYMAPGDLVALIRTSGGRGTLQQFVSDQEKLLSAIDGLKWNPLGRAEVSSVAAINNEDVAATEVDSERVRSFGLGLIGTLNIVVRDLKRLPGRKSVVVLSDGLPLFNSSDPGDNLINPLTRLTEAANRASVTIYTIDARGLQTLTLQAADNLNDDPGGL